MHVHHPKKIWFIIGLKSSSQWWSLTHSQAVYVIRKRFMYTSESTMDIMEKSRKTSPLPLWKTQHLSVASWQRLVRQRPGLGDAPENLGVLKSPMELYHRRRYVVLGKIALEKARYLEVGYLKWPLKSGCVSKWHQISSTTSSWNNKESVGFRKLGVR